jgi:hypothetical protein
MNLADLPIEMKKEERRREPRVRPAGPIRVGIQLTDRLEEGYLEDINNFGAFVTTELSLRSGTRLNLAIHLPGEPEAKLLPAIVVRRRAEIEHAATCLPAGLGMKFIANTREELDFIRHTVITTLSLDLLGHGLRRGSAPSAEETVMSFD